MFDVHSHLLPSIDDGSQSVEMAQRNLRLLIEAGIEGVCFTPHFYPGGLSIDSFIEKRQKSFDLIKDLGELSKIRYSLGAEVYLSYSLFNFEDILPLCFTGTNLILVELGSEDKFSKENETKLTKLVSDYSVTPVLAHIDRYPGVIGDYGVLSFLRDMGLLFQINCSSFETFSRRRLSYKAIKNGYCDFLGNDFHRDEFQPYVFKKRIEKIENKFGHEFIETLNFNSKKIFNF